MAGHVTPNRLTDIYENSQISQVRGRNVAAIRDLNNLDLILSKNNTTPLALDDEFNCYRQRGRLTDTIYQIFSHCVQLIYNTQRCMIVRVLFYNSGNISSRNFHK